MICAVYIKIMEESYIDRKAIFKTGNNQLPIKEIFRGN